MKPVLARERLGLVRSVVRRAASAVALCVAVNAGPWSSVAWSATAVKSKEQAIAVSCPQPQDPQAFDAAFTRATLARHSLAQLTCAAAMSFAAATRDLNEVDMQMLSLDAQMNLLEAVQLQLDTQTYQGGVAYETLKAQWDLGVRQGKVLSARLAKAARTVPSIAGMRLAFELVSVSSSLVPTEVAFRSAAQALKPLQALLAQNPKLLDGTGEMMLGRLYLQLPETAGGDLEQAVVHLRLAHEMAPRNIEFQRWYAESLVALDQKAQALHVLAQMLSLQPESIQLQRHADELRAGVGLAHRSGDEALAMQLSDKRAALFKEHPELLTRQRTAVMGHGGDDPITGKPVD